MQFGLPLAEAGAVGLPLYAARLVAEDLAHHLDTDTDQGDPTTATLIQSLRATQWSGWTCLAKHERRRVAVMPCGLDLQRHLNLLHPADTAPHTLSNLATAGTCDDAHYPHAALTMLRHVALA